MSGGLDPPPPHSTFVGSNDGNTVSLGAWWSFLVANTIHAHRLNNSITRDGLKTYFETELSLPASIRFTSHYSTRLPFDG